MFERPPSGPSARKESGPSPKAIIAKLHRISESELYGADTSIGYALDQVAFSFGSLRSSLSEEQREVFDDGIRTLHETIRRAQRAALDIDAMLSEVPGATPQVISEVYREYGPGHLDRE